MSIEDNWDELFQLCLEFESKTQYTYIHSNSVCNGKDIGSWFKSNITGYLLCKIQDCSKEKKLKQLRTTQKHLKCILGRWISLGAYAQAVKKKGCIIQTPMMARTW